MSQHTPLHRILLAVTGRPQDRLSHVLVSDPYETNSDFYYPTPYEYPIHGRRGDKEITVDAQHARVDLADIPFVLLRDGLPERLRTGQASFSRAVATANRGLQDPHLVLDVATPSVWADDEEIQLSKTEFLILLWLAERAKRGEHTTDWSQPEVAKEFLSDVTPRVCNTNSAEYQRIEESLGWRIAKAHETNEYFQPHKTNLNKAFAYSLGKRSAARYLIGRGRENAFPLVPEQIEILGG